MKKSLILAVTLVALAATGCIYGSIEKDFGKSYAQAKSGQILNPKASQNLNPVTGLSGQAAEAVGKKYVERFGKDAEKASKNGCSTLKDPTKDPGQDSYGK